MRRLILTAMAGTLVANGPVVSQILRSQVRIAFLPAAVETDSALMLIFEVLATPPASTAIDISDLSIVDPDDRQTILRYDRAELARHVSVNGKGARIYVEMPIPARRQPARVIAIIGHIASDGTRREISSPPKPIELDPPVQLAPPLSEGLWVAVHSPDWERGHRRVVVTQNGRETIPGRFAVDWVGVDARGRTTRGDPDRPRDAIGYGAPVLAVADGRIAAIRDGLPESSSIADNPAQPEDLASGNYVALEVGVHRYAIYEHLRPGSVKVRPGQFVRAGQMIGALGFTGDSTGPHLHLHVASCALPIACEGVPFVMDGMVMHGRYHDLSLLGRAGWDSDAPLRKPAPQWPGSNIVVSFDQTRHRTAPAQGTPNRAN